MAEDKDWNAIFAARKATQDAERKAALADAKLAAEGTGKEPFDPARFRQVYATVNADRIDKYTPWDSLLTSAEYDYYVTFPNQMTLQAFVEHRRYLDGWG